MSTMLSRLQPLQNSSSPSPNSNNANSSSVGGLDGNYLRRRSSLPSPRPIPSHPATSSHNGPPSTRLGQDQKPGYAPQSAIDVTVNTNTNAIRSDTSTIMDTSTNTVNTTKPRITVRQFLGEAARGRKTYGHSSRKSCSAIPDHDRDECQDGPSDCRVSLSCSRLSRELTDRMSKQMQSQNQNQNQNQVQEVSKMQRVALGEKDTNVPPAVTSGKENGAI